MSSHVSSAFASEVSAFFRSAGKSWTTPPEIFFALRASFIGFISRVSVSAQNAGHYDRDFYRWPPD